MALMRPLLDSPARVLPLLVALAVLAVASGCASRTPLPHAPLAINVLSSAMEPDDLAAAVEAAGFMGIETIAWDLTIAGTSAPPDALLDRARELGITQGMMVARWTARERAVARDIECVVVIAREPGLARRAQSTTRTRGIVLTESLLPKNPPDLHTVLLVDTASTATLTAHQDPMQPPTGVAVMLPGATPASHGDVWRSASTAPRLVIGSMAGMDIQTQYAWRQMMRGGELMRLYRDVTPFHLETPEGWSARIYLRPDLNRCLMMIERGDRTTPEAITLYPPGMFLDRRYRMTRWGGGASQWVYGRTALREGITIELAPGQCDGFEIVHEEMFRP